MGLAGVARPSAEYPERVAAALSRSVARRRPDGLGVPLEAFLASILTGAVAEMGNWTPLLEPVLSAQYRRSWPLPAVVELNHQ